MTFAQWAKMGLNPPYIILYLLTITKLYIALPFNSIYMIVQQGKI